MSLGAEAAATMGNLTPRGEDKLVESKITECDKQHDDNYPIHARAVCGAIDSSGGTSSSRFKPSGVSSKDPTKDQQREEIRSRAGSQCCEAANRALRTVGAEWFAT